MTKVLQIYPQMNNAGTEKVIMNLYNNINQEKVHFDFLVNRPGVLDEEIRKKGAKIFYINNNDKNNYYINLMKFFKENNYEIIHVHTQGNMELILKAAKKSKIKCRIIHSHTARQDIPKILKILKLYRNIQIERNATDFFACSQDAAKWLFPHKYKSAKIVYNAIEIKKFLYNEEVRKKVRKDLKIKDDEKIVINISRISKGKNHSKIIKIAKKVIDNNKKIKFVFVGTGNLEEDIKNEIKNNHIEDNFILLGNRNDVNELLMAADLFLFPTLYEGLGIAVVEAQFSGLKCITSERVPKEADISLGLLEKIELSKSNDYWAKKIEENFKKKIKRNILDKIDIVKTYDIKNIATDVEEFYLSKR